MARVAVGQFAVTVGSSGSTYIADPDNANQTITTALASRDYVFVKPGTFNFSDTLSVPSGKTFIGDPNDRPTLKMAAGVNKTVITNANASSGGITTGVTIRDFIIDQQGALQTAGGGIVCTGIQNWTLDRIRIKKSYKFNFLCLHQSTGVANNTGTITATKNSATLAGTNTLFTTELSVGSIIKSSGGQFGRVQSIESATSLTLTLPWGSATETNVTYKTIQPNSGCTFTRMRYEGTVNDADASGYGFFDSGTVSGAEAFGANGGGCGFVPDHARSMNLTNLVSHENDNSGISLETCEDCTITNPTTYSNTNGNGGQFISGTSRCTVSGGKAYSQTNNGWVVSYNTTSAGIPRSNVFSSVQGYLNGGYAFRNDGGLATEYSGVTGYNNDTGGLIINTSNSNVPDDVNVHNSTFYDDRGGSKSQDRGIYVVAATDTLVTNNTALDSLHVIAGIVDTGTNTTLSGNTT